MFSRKTANSLSLSILFTAVMLVLTWLGRGEAAQADNMAAYEVKAAFIMNFARFTIWPDAVMSTADNTVDLCVVGDQSLQPAFQSIQGKSIDSRTLDVNFRNQDDNLDECDILFIAGADQESAAEMLAEVQGRPVLTIGEEKDFAEQGGNINFIIIDGKLRFEINQASTRQQGLRLSSRLLGLAILIE